MEILVVYLVIVEHLPQKEGHLESKVVKFKQKWQLCVCDGNTPNV